MCARAYVYACACVWFIKLSFTLLCMFVCVLVCSLYMYAWTLCICGPHAVCCGVRPLCNHQWQTWQPALLLACKFTDDYAEKYWFAT